MLQWLEEPHVKEFWDNSLEHRNDIEIFMEGRTVFSPYWNGIFDYWIGSADGEPYSLVMTSEIVAAAEEVPELWKSHLSTTGKTFSVDFMIGNTKYLGRGLAAPTLEAFARFIADDIDPKVDTFFIDPEATNPRAQHVYAKAGFKYVSSFFAPGCQDPKNVKHSLMIKHLKVLE